MARGRKPPTKINHKRPRSSPLPGMEDRGIKALDDVADQYAEIRDQRMELTQREHDLKGLALKLMHKHGKTIYKHDGIEILVVPGEEDVKVRVKKPADDENEAPIGGAAIADHGEYAAERRAAVAAGED